MNPYVYWAKHAFLNIKKIPFIFIGICALAIYGVSFIQPSACVLAQTTNVPELIDGTVIVNGINKSAIGAVRYNSIERIDNQTGEITTINNIDQITSSKIRLGIEDEITFSGIIESPVGTILSWVRVDIYLTDTEQPYTKGAEYYREDNRKSNQFDLSTIPAMTIGSPIGKSKLSFEAGKEYILMLNVGASEGGTFEDRDRTIDDIQGPAIILSIRYDPKTCVHPHDSYVYIQHASGEMRYMNYGDPYTHQFEPLVERYCGLCDSYLGNIWGQGTTQEHTYNESDTCVDCGYFPLITLDKGTEYEICIPSSISLNNTDGLSIQVTSIAEGNTIAISPMSINGGKLKMGENEISYSYDMSMTFSQLGEKILNISIIPADIIGLPPGTYTDTLSFDISIEKSSEQ